jgi:hypothetical protein
MTLDVGAPLAFIRFENGETCYTVVPEGALLRTTNSNGRKALQLK